MPCRGYSCVQHSKRSHNAPQSGSYVWLTSRARAQCVCKARMHGACARRVCTARVHGACARRVCTLTRDASHLRRRKCNLRSLPLWPVRQGRYLCTSPLVEALSKRG